MNAMMQPLPGFTPDAAMLSQMGGFNPYMAYQMSWQMNQLQQMHQQRMAPATGAFNPMFMPPQLAAAAAMAMQSPASFASAASVPSSNDHLHPREGSRGRGRGRGGFSRGRGRH